MKKKSVFLSKVFAVALAASMAFSTPYASAAVVTETVAYEGGKAVITQDTAFWSAWSDFYRVSGDFDVTFELTNKSDQATNYDNVAIALSNGVDYAEGNPNTIAGYKEYMVMRIDNWCWSTTEANVTVEGNEVVKESDWNWDTFTSVMANAKINLNMKRTGNDFAVTMVIDGADGKTYHQSYKFTTAADKDINIFFTGEKADVSILSYTVNGGAAAETPSTETPAEDTTTPETPAEDTTTPETPAEDTTTPETPAEDTTTPETPAEDTTTPETPAEDEEPAEEETVKAAAKLNKKKAAVKVGKSVKLKVQNTTKKVTWSSSNKKVAKVNKSGKVTGVKAGKAVIKAKVGGKTLKCNVTVK